MATATYDLIASQTLGSAASSITFSSIAASWTDLRLVLTPIATSGTTGGYNVKLNFNNDTSSLYSNTFLVGDGSAAATGSNANVSYNLFSYDGMTHNYPHLYTLDVFSYAGSTYKTSLATFSEDKNGSGYVGRQVFLYRSTSAITEIDLTAVTSTFAAGTTANLYGIKAA
jgi:hypothetical protein